MAKLYVFGIGGTGSRVIKALTMLFASGVDINNYEIVPIIIDPDDANGDLTRTVEILKNYQQIHNKLNFSASHPNQFFKTKISNVTENFRLVLSSIKDGQFKNYIQHSSLDESNKALVSLLFSEDNLNANMEIGFKGNPNLGSVVLNQFNQSEDFINFASSFAKDDRIFIISSIFGGTGAAGFPLLVKNIRGADKSVRGFDFLRNAPLGAITVMPYFGVEPDANSPIDKSTFISKTKAALSYYEKNINGNNSVNVLYYLGDDLTKDYPNVAGASNQKNDAHFLEMAAALSIVDFAKQDSVGSTTYKEFGIKVDANKLNFDDLGSITQSQLKKPLTQYILFHFFLKDKIQDSINQTWAKNINLTEFLGQPFYTNYLKQFNVYYLEWLKEMETNHRGFAPFNLKVDETNLFNIVNKLPPKVKWHETGRNYSRYDFLLAKLDKKSIKTGIQEQHFMDLFYNTTELLVKEKFKF